MKKIFTTFAIALTLCSAPAPVAAQNREHVQMAAELRMLQEQTQQLALTLAQLAEALKAINGRIDESSKSMQTGFALQDLRVKELGNAVSAIREGTQDTNTRLGQLRDEVEAMRTSLTSLPSLLSQFSAPASSPPSAPDAAPNAAGGAPAVPVAPGPAPPPPASTLGLSPGRMYETALSDYRSGQYSIAIDGFEAFLRQFPRSELADDAYVNIGEAHASQMKWEPAIAAYSQAIQNFPGGDQVPLAYYKRGLAEDRLGRTDAARASWQQLIKLHPSSTEAILAKANLDRVNRQQAPARPQ